MSQGAWQDWHDPRFLEFLEKFYGFQLDLARKIAQTSATYNMDVATVAVFEKIAPPAVYLKPYYETWKNDIKDRATEDELNRR